MVKLVFECGVGRTFENGAAVDNGAAKNRGRSFIGSPGASLRAWRDYFPQALIVGADIDSRVLFRENRITTFQVDQTCAESVRCMWARVARFDFDVMIDDGLHTFDAGLCLFENSIDRLSANGVYVIEDVGIHPMGAYIQYFADKNYAVTFAILERPMSPVSSNNNALILIRHPPRDSSISTLPCSRGSTMSLTLDLVMNGPRSAP